MLAWGIEVCAFIALGTLRYGFLIVVVAIDLMELKHLAHRNANFLLVLRDQKLNW